MAGAAYSYSVLFMLGMLFTVLLGFSGACYRLYRKHVRLAQAQPVRPAAESALSWTPGPPA